MIRTLYFCSTTKSTRQNLTVEDVREVLDDPDGCLWVDFYAEEKESCTQILRNIFNFHPLAIADALEEIHVPKIDDWDSYLYLVLHSIQSELAGEPSLSTHELDIFLGKNYLVTYHNDAILTLDHVWEVCLRDQRYLNRGSIYLLYHLADEIIAQYMQAIEHIDDAFNTIEDDIFTSPQPQILELIFSTKRALLKLHRILLPQREVFNKLSRGDYGIIEDQHSVYFRDVYDHVVRLHDITESLRDLISSAIDTHLSVVNNRMNEIMKTLTVITTLFMPLSFLTGFFGMNFFQPAFPLQDWTGKLAFSLTLFALILLPATMFLWMRRRAWM